MDQKAREMKKMQEQLQQLAAALKKAEEAAANQELSPEQKEKVSRQLSDAASKGDTAKVLKLIEQGDTEWPNPDEVG